MQARLMVLHEKLVADLTEPFRFDLAMHHIPLYLYGRYCKYARDISQSPWALLEGVPTAEETEDPDSEAPDTVTASAGTGQKGRGNVEDIIGMAVKVHLGAEQVKLHACGREDIDVRCLGEYSVSLLCSLQ